MSALKQFLAEAERAGVTHITLLPCPFCGDQPHFEGDASVWRDESRYVELSLSCCATMTESIGWRKARDMQPKERDRELRARLTTAWNKRT